MRQFTYSKRIASTALKCSFPAALQRQLLSYVLTKSLQQQTSSAPDPLQVVIQMTKGILERLQGLPIHLYTDTLLTKESKS